MVSSLLSLLKGELNFLDLIEVEVLPSYQLEDFFFEFLFEYLSVYSFDTLPYLSFLFELDSYRKNKEGELAAIFNRFNYQKSELEEAANLNRLYEEFNREDYQYLLKLLYLHLKLEENYNLRSFEKRFANYLLIRKGEM